MVEIPVRKKIHPEVLAKVFGVHLRTIWRWTERRYPLDFQSAAENLLLWKQSCFAYEAPSRLKVCHNTMISWVKLGVLKSIVIYGQTRITLDSINRILNHPEYKPGSKKVLFRNKSTVISVDFVEPTDTDQILNLLIDEVQNFKKIQAKRRRQGYEIVSQKGKQRQALIKESQLERDLLQSSVVEDGLDNARGTFKRPIMKKVVSKRHLTHTKFLTINEVALEIQRTPQQIRKMIDHGVLKLEKGRVRRQLVEDFKRMNL